MRLKWARHDLGTMDSILPNGEVSGTDMNSLNHYAYGAVERFIMKNRLVFSCQINNLDDTRDISNSTKLYKTSRMGEGALQTANGELPVSWNDVSRY